MAPSAKNAARFVTSVLVSLLASACGPSAPAPRPEATAHPSKKPVVARSTRPANTPPSIQDVHIDPEDPVPGQQLRARVNASDKEGDPLWFRYAWRVEGRDAGDGKELLLRDVSKGDRVELQVVADDGKDESEPSTTWIEVADRAPELEVKVEPGREVTAGTPVVVHAKGTDADGDAVDYRYEWTVNGREQNETGPLLETGRLRRGDQIRVRAIVSDGEKEAAVDVPPLVVVNTPPRIVSRPPARLDKGVFRYPVIAQDPDGDAQLEFHLEGAPAGMDIDPYSGLVTWKPGRDQTGVHTVTVVAQDGQKGVARQEFEVRVSEPEAVPAEAAP